MTLSEQLKILAKGINPDTGELLENNSIANSPEGIRLLFSLADELQKQSQTKEGLKLSPEQKRQKNISEGKPANSHFPWSDEDREKLASSFDEDPNISNLASEFERSPLAIAVQLEKLSLISSEVLESYR